MGTAVKQQVGEVSRRQKSVSANQHKQTTLYRLPKWHWWKLSLS